MKKFGLGLSHMIPSKPDEKPIMAAGDAMNNMSPDYTPPSSPYPGRRAPLPQKVELELRSACLGVLTNQRPSHIPYYTDDSARSAGKAQLDYAAIKQSIDKPAVADGPTSHSSQRRRSTLTAASDELPTVVDPSLYAYKPDLPIAALFSTTTTTISANGLPARASSLRRPDQLLADDPLHRRTKSGSVSQMHPPVRLPNFVSAQTDRPKATHRSRSNETSGSTPQTDVTEYPWSTSTAPTTAGVTPARASKRTSQHVPVDADAHAKSETNPIDWVRNEVRKYQNTRSRRPSELEKPDLRANTRAPSRTRSIRSMKSVRSVKSLANSVVDGVIEYVRPGSRSRDTSRSRANPFHRSDHERPERGAAVRPPPRRDWRNWGRSNKEDNSNSSADVSRSNSVRGRTENRKTPTSKPDLNRELPPLPGLSQWKDPEPERPAHIVSVRSPTSRSTAFKSSTVSEKDEIVAARLGSPVRTKPEVYQPTRPPKSGSSTARPSPYAHTGLARTTDTDREIRDGGLRIEFSIEDLLGNSSITTPPHSHTGSHPKSFHSQPELLSNGRAPPSAQHSRSGSSISRSLSLKKPHSYTPSESSKSSSNLGTTAPSFSKHRKYDKGDIPPALTTTHMANQGRKVATKQPHQSEDHRYRHAAEIHGSPLPEGATKDEKKAWWNLKAKSKKPMTWMDQLEKLGIRDGVLMNDELAGSPVVRY